MGFARDMVQCLLIAAASIFHLMALWSIIGVSKWTFKNHGVLITTAVGQLECFVQLSILGWLIRHRRARWIFIVMDFAIILLLWHYMWEVPIPPGSVEVRESPPGVSKPTKVTIVKAFEKPTGSPNEEMARVLLDFAWGFFKSLCTTLLSAAITHGLLVVLNLWGVCEDDRPKKGASDVEQAVPGTVAPPAGPATEQGLQVPGSETTGVVYVSEPENNKEMEVIAERPGCTGDLGCVNKEGATGLPPRVV